jgi:hypothetical protein
MRFKTSLFALLALFAAYNAQAAITVYTDQASFASALSNSSTDTFTDLDDSSSGNLDTKSLTRSTGAYTYTVSSADELIVSDSMMGVSPGILGPVSATDNLLFSAFNSGTTAIGGVFFSTDASFVVDNYPLTLNLVTASGEVKSVPLSSTTASSFVGFISDSQITSLTVVSPSAVANANGYVSTTAITLGMTAAVAAVPEPSSFIMLLAGLGMLGVMVRRRI